MPHWIVGCLQVEAQERKRREGMIPPDEYYKTLQDDLWGSYDEDGIPLTKKDGQEVSKSQRQKLIKVTCTFLMSAVPKIPLTAEQYIPVQSEVFTVEVFAWLAFGGSMVLSRCISRCVSVQFLEKHKQLHESMKKQQMQ